MNVYYILTITIYSLSIASSTPLLSPLSDRDESLEDGEGEKRVSAVREDEEGEAGDINEND